MKLTITCPECRRRCCPTCRPIDQAVVAERIAGRLFDGNGRSGVILHAFSVEGYAITRHGRAAVTALIREELER